MHMRRDRDPLLENVTVLLLIDAASDVVLSYSFHLILENSSLDVCIKFLKKILPRADFLKVTHMTRVNLTRLKQGELEYDKEMKFFVILHNKNEIQTLFLTTASLCKHCLRVQFNITFLATH